MVLLRTWKKKFEFNDRVLEKWTVFFQNWAATQENFSFLSTCLLLVNTDATDETYTN